jgi:hypothetical protein
MQKLDQQAAERLVPALDDSPCDRVRAQATSTKNDSVKAVIPDQAIVGLT